MLRYSFQGFDSKLMVRIAGRNLPISHKDSYEIAKFIKGKKVGKAIVALEQVQEQKLAVPYRRFNRDRSPKKGIRVAGRYPYKASVHIVKLLKNLQGAARTKGLDIQKLTIIHAAMQSAPKRRRYGRKMGLQRKSAHFELIAREVEEKVEKK